MTKLELVNEVVERLKEKEKNVSKKVVMDVVSELFEVMTENLRSGVEVKLIPFGVFKVVNRKERTGINPQSGEKVVIPARQVVKFVPGKKLKMV